VCAATTTSGYSISTIEQTTAQNEIRIKLLYHTMPFIWYRSFESAMSNTGEAMEYDNGEESLTNQESWNWKALKKSQKFMIKAALIVGGGGTIYQSRLHTLTFKYRIYIWLRYWCNIWCAEPARGQIWSLQY
jgi:hypothetical protein